MALHVQLDVEYASDPKIIDAGPMAELLYVRALCFAKRTMRDGCITQSQLRTISIGIPSASRQAQRLVDVGAWEKTGDGWRIAAWLKRNKSADRITSDMAAKRMKSLLGNHERWHVKADRFDPTCELCNPYNGPHKDPHRDPAPDSTEEEVETQEEAEEESESSSGGGVPRGTETTDDDGFSRTVDLIVDAKLAGRKLRRPNGYRRTTTTNTIIEDGDHIRRLLALSLLPEIVARMVLTDEDVDIGPSEPQRHDPDCPLCEGHGWRPTEVNEWNEPAPGARSIRCDCTEPDGILANVLDIRSRIA